MKFDFVLLEFDGDDGAFLMPDERVERGSYSIKDIAYCVENRDNMWWRKPQERFKRPTFPNDLDAETRFKVAVRGLISSKIYPGASAIRKVLCQPYAHLYSGKPTLNGREIKWRNEVADEMSFQLKKYGNPFFEYEPEFPAWY